MLLNHPDVLNPVLIYILISCFQFSAQETLQEKESVISSPSVPCPGDAAGGVGDLTPSLCPLSRRRCRRRSR